MVKRQIMYAACSTGSTIIVLLGIVYGVVMTQATHITLLSFDCQIAPSHHSLMRTFLEQRITQNCYAPTLYNELKQLFPALTSLSVDRRLPSTMKLRLDFDRPLLIVQQPEQQPLLMTKLGDYAPCNHYDASFLEHIPTIMVIDRDFANHQKKLYEWIVLVGSDFFNHYSVCWYSPHQIIVSQPEDHAVDYCITTETNPTDIEKKLVPLYHHLCTTDSQEKSMSCHYRIDARFKDQIISTKKNNLLSKKSIAKGKVL